MLFAGEYLVFEKFIQFVRELFSENIGHGGKKCYGSIVLNIILVTFLE